MLTVKARGLKMKLELTNRILENKLFQSKMKLLEYLEKDRIFCRHDIEHLLSVARITLILCIEKNIEVNPDIIYSASLLHDIGRTAEYTENIPHDEAGIETALQILNQLDCETGTKKQILELVGNHRNGSNDENSLENIFSVADKKSRNCFFCPARNKCNWNEEKKNMNIEV